MRDTLITIGCLLTMLVSSFFIRCRVNTDNVQGEIETINNCEVVEND